MYIKVASTGFYEHISEQHGIAAHMEREGDRKYSNKNKQGLNTWHIHFFFIQNGCLFHQHGRVITLWQFYSQVQQAVS